MGFAAKGLAAVFLVAGIVAAAGCDSGGGEHHYIDLGGVKHAEGYTDPLRRCSECHGVDLRGGRGPSCYSCHDNATHTAVRGGVSHRPGETTICPTCHGPGGSGGLGPSCFTCHGSYPSGTL